MGRTKSNPADRYFERNLIDRDYYVCQCNTDGDAEEQNSENVDNPDSISSSVSTSSTGTNISTSKICGAKVKGKWGMSNLERHLESCHPAVYNELKLLKRKHPENHADSEADNDDKNKKPKLLQTFLPFAQQRMLPLRVLISMQYIKDSCVMLVTDDGRPFSSVEDKAWKKILKPYLKALEENKFKLRVNRKNVGKWVKEKAAEFRQNISQRLKNKIVHIKVDGASKHRRSFLGVNVQFMNENHVIEVVTLGTIEIFERHTAENLKTVILELLKKYDVGIDQIYSFVSDNGANMLRTGRLLNQQSTFTRDNSDGNDDDSNSDDDDNGVQIDPYAHSNYEDEGDSWDTFSIEEHLVDGRCYDQKQAMKETLESEILNEKLDLVWNGVDHIVSVRCAAHTLQLAIIDTWKLNTQNSSEEDEDDYTAVSVPVLIDKIRGIVKQLRTTNGSILLRRLKTKSSLDLSAVLDNDTRWGSTYNMLVRFIKLKPEIQELAKNEDLFHLTVQEWSELESITNSLKPCFEATIKLQNEKCNLRDLAIVFTDCITETKKIDHELARCLLLHLRERRDKLFQNISFLTSLFLDACFKSLLTEDQKKIVKSHIAKLYERILVLSAKNSEILEPEVEAVQQAVNSVSEATSTVVDEDDYRAKIARSNARQRNDIRARAETEKALFGEKLAELEDELKRYEKDVMPEESEVEELMKKPAFNFWKLNKNIYPHLFQLAQIIHSVPCTQVSVERLFSALDFILNKRRLSLLSEAVDDILVIRCNANKQ